jgi:hypothetical protein
MFLDQHAAMEIARDYIGAEVVPAMLGWGVTGFVFVNERLRTAVKIHKFADTCQREMQAYELLKRKRLQEQLRRRFSLNVPRMLASDPERHLIHMDLVRPPFLLDFAGVRFAPPDFSDDVMADWHDQIVEKFGDQFALVYAIYDFLAKRGLYYLDFRPSNLNLSGL